MFGIYDDLTPDHVPGLQKYDMCMTEQVPGPQGLKIVGRHMPSAPNWTMYYLIKLCIQFELEVDRSEFDDLIEEGGGPADIPFLSLLVICHLQ